MRTNILSNLSGWKKFAFVYLSLLIVSHLVIWLFESPIKEKGLANKEIRLQTVLENASKSQQTIEIEYRDVYLGDKSDPPILLMLPGSPEGPSVFSNLVPKLSDDFRLIVPYLPGYGNTQKNLPDYSFKALALYTKQLLNKLQINEVHVVGYGLGGASAIYLAHDSPQKVASLSLISSIGVQELELLGSYTMNHAVYGMQLAVVWMLHNAVPHFGLFEALDVSVPYAKSYYESDQRPLRPYLKAYQEPMLILHGSDDPLVPVAVAEEHFRIVPQSKLKLFNADHDLIETHSDVLGRMLTEFISKVESGKALTASEATPERIEQAQKPFSNVEFAKFKGFSLLIILAVIVLCSFISEDLAAIGAGLLAARGLIGFWEATAACFVGVFVGDVGLYLIGRFMGRPAVRRAPLKWFVTESDLDKSAKWFKVRGPTILFATRFLPGSRFPIYFSSGLIQAGFWRFLSYFLLSAVVWTPLIVGISQLLGSELIYYLSVYQEYAIWIFLSAVFLLVAISKVIIPAFSHRGRRLILSRYRRLRYWQYWPSFIQHAPLFFYIVWLGAKYKCLTLFSATNPALPASKSFGKSKSAMLRLFDSKYIARYTYLPSNLDHKTMINRAREFMNQEKLSFPVVSKPDSETGEGVKIIQNIYELQDYLFNAKSDVIIQEYVGGFEWDIFYARQPDELEGKVYAVAGKEFLKVVGDGMKTLEELILDDERAVNLAKQYITQNEDCQYNIPPEGETVTIVQKGKLSRGANFKDGEELITKKLERKVNETANTATGFFLGSFTVRALSEEDLKEGKGLKIIDVNSVPYLPLNAYDLKFSFIEAQNIFQKHWKRAFEIGKKNRDDGAEIASVSHFFSQL